MGWQHKQDTSRRPIGAWEDNEVTGVSCIACGAPTARICDECRRACAMHSWRGVSRHPESLSALDEVCRLCDSGAAEWCAVCWPAGVVDHRESLSLPGRSRPCHACGGRGRTGRTTFAGESEGLDLGLAFCRTCGGRGRLPVE